MTNLRIRLAWLIKRLLCRLRTGQKEDLSPIIILWKFQCQFSKADPDLQIRGEGGRSSRPWPRSPKKFFSALRASVWSENKGRLVPRAPSLDPPLVLSGGRETFQQFFARREEKLNPFRYKCPITAHMMTKYSLFYIRMSFFRPSEAEYSYFSVDLIGWKHSCNYY